MCLILTPFRRVDLDHIELALLPVPVENALHARPPTPLHAPPARPRAPHPDLRHARDVDVRPIDARIPPPRTPSLLLRLNGNRAASSPARPTQQSARPPLTSHKHASAPTLRPIISSTDHPLLLLLLSIVHLLRPPERGALALRRRRRGRPLARARGGDRIRPPRRLGGRAAGAPHM
jgi:hypothetical protein